MQLTRIRRNIKENNNNFNSTKIINFSNSCFPIFQMAIASAGDLTSYTRVSPSASIPTRLFRPPNFLNLSRINSDAAGMPPAQVYPSSIEEGHTPEDEVMRIPIGNGVEELPITRGGRIAGRVRNFIRRITNADNNPHTILDNDFASVSEDDIEHLASTTTNGVVLQQPVSCCFYYN